MASPPPSFMPSRDRPELDPGVTASDQDAGPLCPEGIRRLFEDYIRMYSTRDDLLTTCFSDNFSGFTGGGDFLVKAKEAWINITRQDFEQVKEAIRIEHRDVSFQLLADTIAVATGFFRIHLPFKDHILSRETARLVLIFRREGPKWMICHSSISIPYPLVREGEVYPLKELVDRNQALECLAKERTLQLSETNVRLQEANHQLALEIAAHKHAEQALKRSEGLYRSILNASPDDITIADLQGRIQMLSPAAFTIFGYEQGEDVFLNHPVTDFLVPEDRERARERIAQRLQGINTGLAEYKGLRKDGSTIDLEANTEFFRDAQGRVAGMVLVVRDITKRKQEEAERRKLETQNQQLKKAESLSRMAGAIAHVFNNELHAVLMGLELALADLPEDGKSTKSLRIAKDAALKAADVSSLMLTYLGQPTKPSVSLNLLRTCMENLPLLRGLLPASVLLESDFGESTPDIRAHPEQIQRILSNLVSNAGEAYGDAGGGVHLSAGSVPASGIPTPHRFPVDFQPLSDAYVFLRVADSGCGIQSQVLEKLFDPFYSSKFPGRGMGLASVLGITRSLDGVITVDSTPGQGSVFTVYFPVHSSPASQAETQPQQEN